MADIDWDDVLAHAAELTTTSADARIDILGYVNTTLVADEFGGESTASYKLARIYLAAHFASIAGLGAAGAAGPVTQESVGGVSRSYAQPFSSMGTPASLDSTAYGKAYRQLVRRSYARAPVVL